MIWPDHEYLEEQRFRQFSMWIEEGNTVSASDVLCCNTAEHRALPGSSASYRVKMRGAVIGLQAEGAQAGTMICNSQVYVILYIIDIH